VSGWAVALIVAVLAIGWPVSLWPLGPCGRCDGSGRNIGSNGKRFGNCGRCKGTERRQRLGSKFVQPSADAAVSTTITTLLAVVSAAIVIGAAEAPQLATDEWVASIHATFADQPLPLALTQRAVHQPPELAQLQSALSGH